MTRSHSRFFFVVAVWTGLALSAGFGVQSAEAQQKSQADLTGYVTVDKVNTSRISKASPAGLSVVGYLGIHAMPDAKGKLVVAHVESESPAAKAGLVEGDQLVSISDKAVSNTEMFRDLLKAKAPGDAVQIAIIRGKQSMNLKATLAPISKVAQAEAGAGGGGGKGGKGGGKGWRKANFRLAIIGIEYSDIKHNAKVAPKDWENSMFTFDTYNKTSATGQKVHGSLADYYKEQSFNKLKVEGKMFNWVQVSKKRNDYAGNNVNKTVLFNEACEKIIARDGKDALSNFDGVFFLYAGGRPQGITRGSIYWPHKSNYRFQNQSFPYFIVQEGGDNMTNISVFCHEFGHMLGLPDLYAQPEKPGSEGVGQWCAMSNQVGNGKPQHFCVWSKEILGWATPTTIDPAIKQKIILSPIEDSGKECLKVLARADGSEYFLLENRKKKGFDASLPAEGLLIWRVVGGRP
ncbi:MAG TPA: M6 family metalloprotease domain-containing protein, partial [Gemmataceae bacterium]|nr:M6 family metalloprotease domain-containing protein [Gemmataceae bacterium]